MTHVTLRYDTESHRVEQSYWGQDSPQWADDKQNGTTVTTTHISQSDRGQAIQSALSSVEAGTDYDANTETPVVTLCYDPDADELYGEVEIQSLPS